MGLVMLTVIYSTTLGSNTGVEGILLPLKGEMEVEMTGKDLILYILENDLENEVVLKDDTFIGFMRAEEAAVKFGVGINTIKAWFSLGKLKGIRIGDSIFLLKNVPDPRKEVKWKK